MTDTAQTATARTDTARTDTALTTARAATARTATATRAPAASSHAAARPRALRTVVFLCMDADTLGGVQRVTHTVAQGLATRGYDVHVAGLEQAADPVRYVENPAYTRHLIGSAPGRSTALSRRLATRRLTRLLAEAGPAYVVMTSPSAVIKVAGHLIPGQRGIGLYHGSFAHARDTWHFGSIRKRYGKLDQAVFLSPDDARQFAEAALLPNTWHIPNPLPAWPSSVSPLTAPAILGVGRLTGVKRFDRLITAFARATRHGAHPCWRLHLIGDGPDELRLRDHASHEGVAGTVVFHGRIPAARMPSHYLDASLLALSSDHEGLPLAVAEAASYGVPSVAFDISGGIRSLITHNETGVLVPPADVQHLAQALDRLMTCPTTRHRLGTAARTHATRFRQESVLPQWESLFHHLTR